MLCGIASTASATFVSLANVTCVPATVSVALAPNKISHYILCSLDMHMEEGSTKANAGGLFKLVDDHADNAAKKQGLRHHHSNLYELEEDVVDVFENAPDIQRAKDIYPIFRQENEEHLKEEENILMPAIQKMMKNGVNVKKYIKKDIMPILLHQEGDLEFFLRFGNEVLERHDNAPDKPRVRVFDHAFWALASKEEWAKWKVWIQDSLSPEKYAELDAAIAAFEEEQAAKKKSRTQEKLAKETPPLTSISTQPKRSLLAIVFGKAAA